jgi:hypothetical protein
MSENHRTWPDVVGKRGEDAKTFILSQDPSLNVVIVPPGTVVDRVFKSNRVLVYVD